MDYYTIAALVKIVGRLDQPQNFLLDTFFGDESNSDEEEIIFDIEDSKRRIAPFCSPLVEGKIVQGMGFRAKRFAPAYIKDKRALNPRKPLKRRVGETIGGDQNVTPAQREAASLKEEMQDQVNMLNRRKELMASDTLQDGKLIVSGEGYDTVELDFGRDAGNTVALVGAARWGEAGVSPVKDLRAWRRQVLKASGVKVTDIVFTGDAFELFIDDPLIKDAINTEHRGSKSELELISNPGEGGEYQGRLGAAGPRLWVYEGWYVDDNDVGQDILPPYTVLMGSTAPEAMGVRYHGAIIDPKAQYKGMPYFPKSWLVEDPAQRFVMMQSAPLVAPSRPDSTFAATVR